MKEENKKTLINFFALCDYLNVHPIAKEIICDCVFANMNPDQKVEKTILRLKEALPENCFINLK